MVRPRANIGRSSRNTRQHAASRNAISESVPPNLFTTQSTNEKRLADLFSKTLDETELVTCENCLRTKLKTRSQHRLCNICRRHPTKFTSANNMLPGDIPPSLQNLTPVEQMIIARVAPVMRVYQVRASGQPGQFHYRGNIINVEQDITEIASELPRTPSNLNIVVVHRQGISGHSDFKVRRQKVLDALLYLKANHKYYADIVVNQQAIDSLPIDGNVESSMRYLRSDGLDENVLEDDDIVETAVPMTVQRRQEDAILTSLNWPSNISTPINEFRTSGYVTMAFPHLFPNGEADYNDFGRNEKLTFHEWSEYLVQYHDRRFAKDPRFRFFCLNTMQRHEALQRSAIFAKKNEFTGTVNDLRNHLARNPNLIKKLLSWGSKTRGSSSYWYRRRSELQDMVNQLGVPTLFLTLSSADLWWPCLVKHFGLSESDLSSMTEKQISRKMQKLLNDNPHIADAYFAKRVKEFFKILGKKFKLKDYWYRFEYQHRGSPHIHSLLWLENAPDVRTFDTATNDQLLEYKLYYDSIVSAFNPNPEATPAEIHPSRIKCSEVNLEDSHAFAQLLNRVNRHTKHGSYCQRTVRGQQTCRFGFPKELLEESSLVKDEKGIWIYKPKRNDPLLNEHSPFVAKLWRANTDCKIIASEEAIINYLSKYATKSEPSSSDFQSLFSEIVDGCRNEEPARVAFSKLLIKLIGERDISACEVMHLLTSEPLVKSTRSFVRLYIGSEEYELVPDADDNSEFIPATLLEHYSQRSVDLEDMNLQQFASNYHVVRRRIVKRRKAAILQVLPKLVLGLSEAQDEIFYKQKLQLHRPYRSLEELKTRDTWKESFIAANISFWELEDVIISPEDAEEVAGLLVEPHEWNELAAAMPHNPIADTALGFRNIDREFNWNETFYKYPEIENNLAFIKTAKETYVQQRETIETCDVQMNYEQLQVINKVQRQMSGSTENKLTIVQGSAGTGKSLVIRKIVEVVESIHGEGTVLLMAPTGVAANNINGQTIHSALHLIVSRNGATADLTGEIERNFQDRMSRVKVIICDEMSMIGLKMLATIDQRLRQAYPANQSTEFGGTILYLFGDFSQLPPVGDTSLLATPKPTNNKAVRGKLLFQMFTSVIELNQVMRQSGPEQQAFRNTLKNISLGEVNDEDYDLLRSRFVSNNRNNLPRFVNAIRLKSKRNEIALYNEQMLRNLEKPVARIDAKHNNETARNATPEEAQGLPPFLCLAAGCRVMLTQNLWTAEGLCNGTLGTVVDVVYSPTDSEDITSEFPLCVLVKFDNFTGPTLYNDAIPILPQTVSFKKGSVSCSRKQFPLEVAYAITIHKSQGITVDKAVVDIGESEFGLGLSYVAFSRVRKLEGLLIEPEFPKNRLLAINRHVGWNSKRAEMERLRSIANLL